MLSNEKYLRNILNNNVHNYSNNPNNPNIDSKATGINKQLIEIKNNFSKNSVSIPSYITNHENIKQTNIEKNKRFLNEQIRLNNLLEIDKFKQITIYVMYIIVAISSALLIFLLK